MDDAAFEPIFQRQLAELTAFISAEAVLPLPFAVGRRVYIPIDGIRPDGRKDRFLLSIDASGFPLYPLDVSFVDPALDASLLGAISNAKESRWFPYDGETRFKTNFHLEPRVFVCIQPGFSKEYFFHHKTEQWDPHAWPLLRVVHQVRAAVHGAPYQCPNCERQ